MPNPLLATLTVLACAAAWSTFDIVRKALVEVIPPIPLVFVITAGQVPLFVLWAILDGDGAFQTGYWLPALASVVLNIGANVAIITAIKVSPLSVTIPLLSLIPAFTTAFALPMLGERPSAIQVVGVVTVVVGAFLLSAQVGEPDSASDKPTSLGGALRRLAKGFLRERGAVLMTITALLWSITLPLDKIATERSTPALHALVLSVGVAIGIFILLVARRELPALATVRKKPVVLLVALVASAAGLGFQLLAIRMAMVSVVETVKRALGNVIALVVGALFFRETVRRSQWLAVLLMIVGVGLIFI